MQFKGTAFNCLRDAYLIGLPSGTVNRCLRSSFYACFRFIQRFWSFARNTRRLFTSNLIFSAVVDFVDNIYCQCIPIYSRKGVADKIPVIPKVEQRNQDKAEIKQNEP